MNLQKWGCIMKKAVLGTAAAACLAAASAWAQLSPDAGWRLGLNPHDNSPAAHLSGTGLVSGLSAWGPFLRLQTSYELVLGTRNVLGLGMTAGPQARRATWPFQGGSEPGLRPGEAGYSLYAEPGHVLGQDTLLYGRLAYLGPGAEGLAGEPYGDSFAGLGYGAGVRTLLGERLYLQVELMQSGAAWRASSSGVLRPATTSGSIGLGWRF